MEGINDILSVLLRTQGLQEDRFAFLQDDRFAFLRDFVGSENPDQLDVANEQEPVCFCPEDHKSPIHTDYCNELKTLKKRVVQQQQKLMNHNGENLLETMEAIPQGRSSPGEGFLCTLYDFAFGLFKVAVKKEGKEGKSLMEEALKHYMLYIGWSDDISNSSALGQIPFVLLNLQRYDDLYEFVRFHLEQETITTEQQKTAKSGQFPFVVSKGCATQSIAEECNAEALQTHTPLILSHLVAVFLMQVNLQSKIRKEAELASSVFAGTESGEALEQVSSVIKEFVCGNDETRASEKKFHDKLLDAIDALNPSILPALVHPEPLKQEHEDVNVPGMFFRRCPMEAYITLMLSEGAFRNAPIAREILVERFGGETPRYHFQPFDYPPEEFDFQ